MGFSQRLKQLRKLRGFSQEKLKNLANISVSNISRYEDGAIQPSVEKVILLAKVLDTSVEYLMNGIENEDNLDVEVFEMAKKIQKLSKEDKKALSHIIHQMGFKDRLMQNHNFSEEDLKGV